ncbi:MAG: hypothetical protein ABS44_09410 [Chryseobacterium sp. SCN 40-13]|nr:MAG: hypothetical protein ABS44_09410 [Chryseobacterium sp. SCN 40-13]
MPINNLNNAHLTPAQITAAQDALTQLETALAMLTVTLTPEERSTYGSVNEQNKLLINKVWDYRRNSANLSVPDLDWDEFEKDYNSRQIMENLQNRLASLQERIKNAKILHDYDNYQSALDDYAYTSYKAGSQAPGYETKMNEMKQFFNRSGKGKEQPVPNTENPTP